MNSADTDTPPEISYSAKYVTHSRKLVLTISGTMKAHLLWQALEYPSLEHCVVHHTSTGYEVSSVLVGLTGNKDFRIEYRIVINAEWQTLSVDVHYDISGSIQTLHYSGNGQGKWTVDGKDSPAFDGCIDVDLPLTPFTNSLPINRLNMSEGDQRLIRVIYLDIIEGEIKCVSQKYTKLSSTEYKYENVPNDFEAVITVDETGLVTHYPRLFERISKQLC